MIIMMVMKAHNSEWQLLTFISSLRYENRLLLIVVANYKNSSRQQIQVIIIVISILK